MFWSLKFSPPWNGILRTSVVAVVGLTTSPLTVLGLSSPVSHATQLVTLGERSIGDALQHVVGSGRGAPGVIGRKGRDNVGNRKRSHDGSTDSGTGDEGESSNSKGWGG